MGFMDAYKHLEKLCGEVMGDERRVSAYIDEMIRNPQGSRCVMGWDSDLRQLKHYRWVRNRIVHEPDCFQEDLCSEEDILWIEDFYDRIMEQSDPLTLYRKATQPRDRHQKTVGLDDLESPEIPLDPPLQRHGHGGCALYLLGIIGVCVLLLV